MKIVDNFKNIWLFVAIVIGFIILISLAYWIDTKEYIPFLKSLFSFLCWIVVGIWGKWYLIKNKFK